MFRLTQTMRELIAPTPLRAARRPAAPVVIWNLVRRCNLTCRHCYSTSADIDFAGELSTDAAFAVVDDLAAMRVPALILSGGEPLLRPDLFRIAARARTAGCHLALSTNGTLVGPQTIDAIAEARFDYVGVSLDGLRDTHDRFRRREGAFDASLAGLRLLRDRGVRTGIRFTLTQENFADLPALLRLLDEEGIDKFYLSHLNYAGRGHVNRRRDAHLKTTRRAMDLLIDTCWRGLRSGTARDVVTGNNDADAVYFQQWVEANHPGHAAHVRAKLVEWGGNATGTGVANIDPLGNVHPDTYWWDVTLGNVRDTPFSQLWRGTSHPLMSGLRAPQRPLEGRCGRCPQRDICNGNTRVRAWRTTGNWWAEDPACYLTDAALGLAAVAPHARPTVAVA
jgi:heme d1 biosynthesis radical SAM protein NirJ